MNEKKHRLSEQLVSPRVFNHWIATGLIEDQRFEGKGWHSLSQSDLLWLKLVLKLRQFGVSLDALKEVKRSLEAERNNWSARPLLEFYLAYTIATKTPARILVFPTGQTLIGSQLEIDWSLNLQLIVDDFVSIDVARLAGLKGEIDYVSYSHSQIEKDFASEITREDVVSVTVESKSNKYILTTEQLMDNKNAALAARQLVQYGCLQETIDRGQSRFLIKNSKLIRK